MKKNLLLLLNLLLCFNTFLSAQWIGIDNKTVPIQNQGSIDMSLTVHFPLTVGKRTSIDTLNSSCAVDSVVELRIIDLGDSLQLSICNTVYTYGYNPNKVWINNGKGKKLTIQKAAVSKKNYPFDFSIDPIVPYVFYDALVLKLGSPSQKDTVFKKYKLHRNPNIHPSLKAVSLELSSANLNTSKNNDSNPSFSSSSIGGISVTKVADGFAKFIASQFKKELTIAFFSRFTDAINKPKTKDLQTLFKNTHSELNLIGDRFTHYQAYLSSLRQSMEYDCHRLPDRLKSLMEDPQSQISTALSSAPDVQYVLDNVLSLGLELRDSVHLGKALANLSLNKNIGPTPVDQNLKGSFATVQLLSEALRSMDDGPNSSYWVPTDQMSYLLKDTSLLHYFIALTAEISKVDTIRFSTGTLSSLLETSKISESKKMIASVIASIQSVDKVILAARVNKHEDNKDILALEYFDAATNLINASKHLTPLLSVSDRKKLEVFNKYASEINNMTQSFITKKYALGLLNLSRVISQIDSTSNTLKAINKVLTNQGLFVAQMAESKTSDDVAAVLENFAAPTGSWRDKRTARWNIAFDSYIGPALYKIQEEKARFAFSTPVGASVTIPFNYVTFFVSIADLGPITSFRLVNDTTEIANLYLKEILSPGVFVSLNFGDNCPVTLNAGYQQFPLLRGVGEENNTVNLNRKGGFSGSIVVNIPLFTIYNKRED